MRIVIEIPGYKLIKSADLGDKPMGEIENEIVSAIESKNILTVKIDFGLVILPPELVAKAVVRIIKQ